MCMFQKKKLNRKKKSRKNRPTGGCSPRGGCMGVYYPRGGLWSPEKKVPKKISKKYCPNRVINSICACFRKTIFFKSKKKIEKKNRPTCVPQGGLQGGIFPQGGLQGGCSPPKKKVPEKISKKKLP